MLITLLLLLIVVGVVVQILRPYIDGTIYKILLVVVVLVAVVLILQIFGLVGNLRLR